MTKLPFPLAEDLSLWAGEQLRQGVSPKTIAHILQLSELTGESPQSIVQRYNELRMELNRVFYSIQP